MVDFLKAFFTKGSTRIDIGDASVFYLSIDITGGTGNLLPLLTNPEKFFENLARKTELMVRYQYLMYDMINEHFKQQVNSDGTPWEPLAENTIAMREKGYSRIGYGKSHRYSRPAVGVLPMYGSSEYAKDLSPMSMSTIHKITTGTFPMLAQVGTRLPQKVNEFGQTNKSKYFKGAKVPKREVVYFSNKNVEEVINLTETFLFEGVLEAFEEG